MTRCFALVTLLTLSSALCQEGQGSSKNLKQYQKKIEEQKGRLSGLARQETSLHVELQQSYKRMERLQKEISKLETQRKELQDRLLQTNVNLASTGKSLEEKQREVFSHIRTFFTHSAPKMPQTLFSSSSAADFQYKQWLVRRWIAYEGEIMRSFKDKTENLVDQKSQVETNQATLAILLKRLEVKKRQFKSDQQERQKLLSLVQDQKDFYAQSIRELENAAKDLEKLLSSMKGSSVQNSRFRQMYGKLPLPVRGKLEKVYGPYIDQRLKTKVYHKGIDLRVASGTLVRAVFDGKVVFADWFVGYGKIVIIDHDGEYFTLYAHLSDILKSVGEQAVVGEPIAKVGDSGSFKGAFLYFEVRKKGISEDPAPWFSTSSWR